MFEQNIIENEDMKKKKAYRIRNYDFDKIFKLS